MLDMKTQGSLYLIIIQAITLTPTLRPPRRHTLAI